MDKYKLEYFIRARNLNQTSFCKLLGISKTAYYRKTNGKSDFTREEILKIADILDLSGDEILEIFFVQKVS